MISWIINTEVCVNKEHEVLIIHDIMRNPNSLIVLLYIFHIIHPQKQKRSVQPFCFWGEHSKVLSNQADVELDMINAISAADMFTSYCELIECSRPIRFFIVSMMYNKTTYHPKKIRNQKTHSHHSSHLQSKKITSPKYIFPGNRCFLLKRNAWLRIVYILL